MITRVFQFFKAVLIMVSVLTMLQASLIAASSDSKTTITFRERVGSVEKVGYLEGVYPSVEVGLYKKSGTVLKAEDQLWKEDHSKVYFNNGFFNLIIGNGTNQVGHVTYIKNKKYNVGNDFSANWFSVTNNIVIGLKVGGIKNRIFEFELSAIPYTIRSKVSETATNMDASVLVTGNIKDQRTVFSKTVTVNADTSLSDLVYIKNEIPRVLLGRNPEKKALGFLTFNKSRLSQIPNIRESDIEKVWKNLDFHGYIKILDDNTSQAHVIPPVNIDNHLFLIDMKPVLLKKYKEDLRKIFKQYLEETAGIEIDGSVKATAYFKNGNPLLDTFSWKKSKLNPNSIYLTGRKLGIQKSMPRHDVHVKGAINAHQYKLNGFDLETSWIVTGNGTNPESNIYTKPNTKVGIDVYYPIEAVEVNGGIKLGDRHSVKLGQKVPTQPGTIIWDGKNFKGFVNNKWENLLIFVGNGKKNEIGFLKNYRELNRSPSFIWDTDTNRLNIGVEKSNSKVNIASNRYVDKLLKISTANVGTKNQVVMEITNDGLVGIGTTPNTHLVQVAGITNSEDMLEGGLPIRLVYALGTYFKKNKEKDIYYQRGNVGIGMPDPTSNLEIASPYKEEDIDIPLKDAAISMEYVKDGTPFTYTMGVDADGPDGVFLIENSSKLGSTKPLFVSQDDRFGVGVLPPAANLHVSGNLGLIVSGEIDTATASASLPTEGPGTRLNFYPRKGALRIGTLANTSKLEGKEWDERRIGELSILFGFNNVASGTYTSLIGGANNDLEGAYSTILGGSDHNVRGFFALALGEKTKINHHGSFAWNDYGFGIAKQALETASPNQVVINAISGVGIGSNRTDLNGEPSLLTLSASAVMKSDFLETLPNYKGLTQETDEDLKNVNKIWQQLVKDNYIDSNGHFKKFMTNFDIPTNYIAYPFRAEISTFNVYKELKAIYPAKRVSPDMFVNLITIHEDLDDFITPEHVFNKWKAINEIAYARVFNNLKDLEVVTLNILGKMVVNKNLKIKTKDYDLNDIKYTKHPYYVKDPSLVVNFLNSKKNKEVLAIDFQPFIDLGDKFNKDRYQEYKETQLKEYISYRIWSQLLQKNYIRKNKVFDKFRPSFVENEDYNKLVPGVTVAQINKVLMTRYKQQLFDSRGLKEVQGLSLYNNAKVNVGYKDQGSAALAVNGNLGIGTTKTSAPLTIQANNNIIEDGENAGRPYIFEVHSLKDVNTIAEYPDSALTVFNQTAELIKKKDVDPVVIPTKSVYPTPSFVVNSKGRVGFNIFNDINPTANGKRITGNISVRVGDGGVRAAGLLLPSGQEISQKPPVIVWSYVDIKDPEFSDIYYTSGNVGIGTIEPNSLLELSNEEANDPVITYDLNGVDYYTMGVSQKKPSAFQIVPKGKLDNIDPVFSVVDNKIGINTIDPKHQLHVSGNVYSKGVYFKLDHNQKEKKDYGFIANNLYTKRLIINGENIVGSGTKWVPTRNELEDIDWIYRRDLLTNIGFGTDDPSAYVDIAGTLKYKDGLNIRQELFSKEEIKLNKLKFKNGTPIPSELYVTGSYLILESKLPPKTFNISNVLTRGEASEGEFIVWKDAENSILVDSAIYWSDSQKDPGWEYNQNQQKWEFKPSYSYDKTFKQPTTMFPVIPKKYLDSPEKYPNEIKRVQNSHIKLSRTFVSTENNDINLLNKFTFGAETKNVNSKIDAEFTYSGVFFKDSYSHSVGRINVNYDFEEDLLNFTPRGINIQIKGEKDKNNRVPSIVNGTTLTGLNVDVSDVSVQLGGEQTRGFKHPAIFKGDVGIGTEPIRPGIELYPRLAPADAIKKLSDTYLLDIKGALRATSFNITERLIITTINVIPDSLVVTDKGAVGVNTGSPSTKLEIDGLTAANFTSSNYIEAPNVQFSSNKLIIKEDGYIGFRKLENENQIVSLELDKQFENQINQPFTYHTVSINLNLADPKPVTDSITGLDISMLSNTSQNTFSIEKIKGIDIDLTQLENLYQDIDKDGIFEDNAKVVGLDVVITKNVIAATSTDPKYPSMNVAVFMGGKVGIGTSTPEYTLDVNGNIYANDTKSLQFENALEGATITQRLVVSNNLTFSYKIPNAKIVTMNYVEVDNIILKDLSVATPDATSLNIVNLLTGNNLNITSNTDAVNVNVNNKLKAVSMNVLFLKEGDTDSSQALAVKNTLTVNSITVNNTTTSKVIKDNQFAVKNNVGIGTSESFNKLHVNIEPLKKNFLEVKFDPRDNLSWNAIRYQVSSNNVTNLSAGLLLAAGAEKDHVPAGVVALNESRPTGSHLVILTGKERIRASSTGNIFIGRKTELLDIDNKTPALFSIEGTVKTSSFLIDKTKPTDQNFIIIEGIGGSPSILSPAIVTTSRSIIADKFIVQDVLAIPTLSNFEVLKNQGGLFVSSNKSLFYTNHFDGDANKVFGSFDNPFFVTEKNTIPFYTATRNLHSSTMKFVTSNINSRLQLNSTQAKLAAIIQNGTIPTYNLNQNISLLSLKTTQSFFPKNLKTTSFNLVHIKATGNPNTRDKTIQDSIVGLSVNLSQLQSENIINVGSEVFETKGVKNAARFLGGNVGISTSENTNVVHFEPKSTLHILNTTENYSFIVQPKASLKHSMIVSSNGLVGINTDVPKGVLHIGTSENRTTLLVKSVEGEPLFSVADSINIGPSAINKTASLNIEGKIKAESLNAKFIKGNSLAINNGTASILSVTDKGNIGFGIAVPEAQLHIRREINKNVIQNNQSGYIHQAININTSGAKPVTESITGISMIISSNIETETDRRKNSLDDNYTAKGLNIDLRSIQKNTSSNVIGLVVNAKTKIKAAGGGGIGGVVGGTDPVKNIAALFNGGNVGINTLQPTEKLHINDTIKTKQLTLTDTVALTLKDVTVNSVIVTNSIMANVKMDQLNSSENLEVNILRLPYSFEELKDNNITVNITGKIVVKPKTEGDKTIPSRLFFGTSFPNPTNSIMVAINRNENEIKPGFNGIAIGKEGSATFNISNSLTVTSSGYLQLQKITSNKDNLLSIFSNALIVTGNTVGQKGVTINQGLASNKLMFNNMSLSPTHRSHSGLLYRNSDSNHLMFKMHDGTEKNISAVVKSTPNTVVKFAKDTITSSNIFTYFNRNQLNFSIGTSNVANTQYFNKKDKLTITSNISATAIFENNSFFAHDINGFFPNRQTAKDGSNKVLRGLWIKSGSINTNQDIEKLHGKGKGNGAKEKVLIGLEVDMSKLNAKTTDQTEGSNNVSGEKYAGIFTGGSVGIIVSPNSETLSYKLTTRKIPLPSANVHIISNMIAHDKDSKRPIQNDLWIETTQNTVFLVTKNFSTTELVTRNYISIGKKDNITKSNAHLTLISPSDKPSFQIDNNTNTLLSIKKNANGKYGLGINTSEIDSQLNLKGNGINDILNISTISTANIFHISNENKIGLRTANPTSILEINSNKINKYYLQIGLGSQSLIVTQNQVLVNLKGDKPEKTTKESINALKVNKSLYSGVNTENRTADNTHIKVDTAIRSKNIPATIAEFTSDNQSYYWSYINNDSATGLEIILKNQNVAVPGELLLNELSNAAGPVQITPGQIRYQPFIINTINQGDIKIKNIKLGVKNGNGQQITATLLDKDGNPAPDTIPVDKILSSDGTDTSYNTISFNSNTLITNQVYYLKIENKGTQTIELSPQEQTVGQILTVPNDPNGLSIATQQNMMMDIIRQLPENQFYVGFNKLDFKIKPSSMSTDLLNIGQKGVAINTDVVGRATTANFIVKASKSDNIVDVSQYSGNQKVQSLFISRGGSVGIGTSNVGVGTNASALVVDGNTKVYQVSKNENGTALTFTAPNQNYNFTITSNYTPFVQERITSTSTSNFMIEKKIKTNSGIDYTAASVKTNVGMEWGYFQKESNPNIKKDLNGLFVNIRSGTNLGAIKRKDMHVLENDSSDDTAIVDATKDISTGQQTDLPIVHGVKVYMDLLAKDPSFGTKEGKIVPASFTSLDSQGVRDTKVGIGIVVSQNYDWKPSLPALHVGAFQSFDTKAFDISKAYEDLRPTGTIALLETDDIYIDFTGDNFQQQLTSYVDGEPPVTFDANSDSGLSEKKGGSQLFITALFDKESGIETTYTGNKPIRVYKSNEFDDASDIDDFEDGELPLYIQNYAMRAINTTDKLTKEVINVNADLMTMINTELDNADIIKKPGIGTERQGGELADDWYQKVKDQQLFGGAKLIKANVIERVLRQYNQRQSFAFMVRFKQPIVEGRNVKFMWNKYNMMPNEEFMWYRNPTGLDDKGIGVDSTDYSVKKKVETYGGYTAANEEISAYGWKKTKGVNKGADVYGVDPKDTKIEIPLIMMTGTQPLIGANAFGGRVGIGIIPGDFLNGNKTNPLHSTSIGSKTAHQGSQKLLNQIHEALTVSGDMRIGIVNPKGAQTGIFPGKLIFSGGPNFYTGDGKLDHSENRDQFFMFRRNFQENKTHLVVQLKDEYDLETDISFKIGHETDLKRGDSKDNLKDKNQLTTKYGPLIGDANSDNSTFKTAFIFTLKQNVNGESLTDAKPMVGIGEYRKNETITIDSKNLSKQNNIGTQSDIDQFYSPLTQDNIKSYLHVQGRSIFNTNEKVYPNTAANAFTNQENDEEHVARFEDLKKVSKHEQSVLGINFASAATADSFNYMTFLKWNATKSNSATAVEGYNSLGAIEGYATGVSFSSPEKDYAEYLPKLNQAEVLNQGDIVGIVKGKVTKSIENAESIMVISTTPIVVANWQPEDKLDEFALVAFIGQVPIKIKGSAQKGDYIIASGNNDGIGYAINPDKIQLNQIPLLVGQAINDVSDNQTTQKVLCFVGFPFKYQAIQHIKQNLEIKMIKSKQEMMAYKDQMNQTLDNRQNKIKELKLKIKELSQ
ncbi:hypothetical protein DID75_00405 [Candidatus Marinamargulisbacteria bacterium SCGC AG-410-N11]|nr:hypothetical protein DID75_00405 [Candidatus Marinamargulisbacteria bacterium SCGC AG-410-N11]